MIVGANLYDIKTIIHIAVYKGLEIFVKFYKARQYRLNPTFFRDMANGRPNGGKIDDDFFEILNNLIRYDAFKKCRCKGPRKLCKHCIVSELVEFMLQDDSEDSDTESEKSENSDCWETESESGEEISEDETEYEKACKENPKLRNRLYLSIYGNLKREEN